MSTLSTALWACVAAGPRELALELLVEAAPVDQAGQLIVVGEVAQALLVAHSLGDVARDHRDRHDPVVGIADG